MARVRKFQKAVSFSQVHKISIRLQEEACAEKEPKGLEETVLGDEEERGEVEAIKHGIIVESKVHYKGLHILRSLRPLHQIQHQL